MDKKVGIITSIILLIMLSSLQISAFGVAIPYWESPEWYPLKLAPGESEVIQLTLQNTGEENMTIKAVIDSDIALLDDRNDEYEVPSGEINRKVNIKVEIPKDAEVGERYKVYSSFKEISGEDEGMIKMAGAFSTKFPVEVVGKEESVKYQVKEDSPVILWIVITTLLTLVIAIALQKKERKWTPSVFPNKF